MIAPVLTAALYYDNHYKRANHLTASPLTVEQFRNSVLIFSNYMPAGFDFRYITTEHIDAFKEFRLLTVAPATVNRDLRHLRALIKFGRKKARKSLRLHYRVDVVMLTAILEDPEAWSMEEVTAILQSAALEQGTIAGIPAAMWWRTMLMTIVNTASRISAIMQLMPKSYVRQSGLLVRRAKTQKHKKTQADILAPVVREAIEQLIDLDPEREYLFPWPWDLPKPIAGTNKTKRSWRTLWSHYRRILKRAGLPITRGDLFHRLRKTTITHIAAASDQENARKAGGHSSLKVTSRYIDPSKMPGNETGKHIDWQQITGAATQTLMF